MAKPNRERRRKSVSVDKNQEPLEVVVSFSLPDPPPLAFPGTKPAERPAKKADQRVRPPLTFRF